MDNVSRIPNNMIKEDSDFLLYSTWGSSMFPFICGGDYILVKRVPLEIIQPGDVIVFESDNKEKICHRVVEIEKKDSILWFHTKGYKNNSYGISPVRQEKVLGKVVAIRRKSSVIELSTGGAESLRFKFDCFLTANIFCIKKILPKIPFLKEIYRYAVKKYERYRCRLF